jgi:alkanesulfonate monooxygenase SsuD/methylene tetrahydromethanopterin reductase-like flavin-dependent oxidoreductase (luciferase family)
MRRLSTRGDSSRSTTVDYKNYDKMIEKVRTETFESQLQHHAAFVGTPADIIEQLHEFDRVMGGVDHASMQVNFNDMPYADAEQSVRLFGEKVIPHFAAELVAR